MGIHSEEGGLAFAQIERKTSVLRPALQSKQSSFCGLHSSGDRVENNHMFRLSAQRQQLTEERREAGKLLMKKEKSTGPRTDLAEHLDGLERNDFCDFDKPRKRACQKGKIESNEQSKEGGQPK